MDIYSIDNFRLSRDLTNSGSSFTNRPGSNDRSASVKRIFVKELKLQSKFPHPNFFIQHATLLNLSLIKLMP
jgi:hypothetical protein